jgi:hypothetical protein
MAAAPRRSLSGFAWSVQMWPLTAVPVGGLSLRGAILHMGAFVESRNGLARHDHTEYHWHLGYNASVEVSTGTGPNVMADGFPEPCS